MNHEVKVRLVGVEFEKGIVTLRLLSGHENVTFRLNKELEIDFS